MGVQHARLQAQQFSLHRAVASEIRSGTDGIHHLGHLDQRDFATRLIGPIRIRPGPDRWEKEAVCVGTTQFDATAIRLIAEQRPGWRLHIVGRLTPAQSDGLPQNVVRHGERPFEETAAFVKTADLGLAPYLDRPGVEYQATHSNRILLCRYFGLPILGPNRLTDPEIPSVFGYDVSDPESVETALRAAEDFTPHPERDPIPDWEELYLRLASTGRLQDTKSAA